MALARKLGDVGDGDSIVQSCGRVDCLSRCSQLPLVASGLLFPSAAWGCRHFALDQYVRESSTSAHSLEGARGPG